MTFPELIKFPDDNSGWINGVSSAVVTALENDGCFMAKWKNLKGCHDALFNDLSKKISKKPNVSYELEFKYDKDPVLPSLPPAIEDMGQAILGYARTAGVLELGVRKMVKLTKEPTHYKFRMKKYEKEVTLGCSDDQEFLAVLDLNQVKRLEMKLKDGPWVRIDAKPETFLITAGKPLKDRISKDPPKYRVTMKDEKEEKYWVGLYAYYDKIEVPKKPVGSSSRP